MFIASSALLSVLPVYLFNQVYLVDTIGMLVYVIVSLVSTVLLYKSYDRVQQRDNTRLLEIVSREIADNPNDYKKTNMNKDEYIKDQQMKTARTSMYFSVFWNNLIYVLVFTFCAFYTFKEAQRNICYVVSVSAASITVWKLSEYLYP